MTEQIKMVKKPRNIDLFKLGSDAKRMVTSRREEDALVDFHARKNRTKPKPNEVRNERD